MEIAYHFTIPRPPQPELDAAIQEALKLKSSFPGSLNYLYPAKQAKRYIPRFLCGLHQLPMLAQLDKQVDIHQFYSNGLYPYPILSRLKKPIVYSTVTGLQNATAPLFRPLLKYVHTFVVSNETDRKIINSWGFQKVEVIPPGLDLSRFSYSPTPPGKFVLMAGSAPWSTAQFKTKGFDLLLEAAQAIPDLHLVMLWRGVLLEEIKERVRRHNLTERVEIIAERVDVNKVLERVHATVVLTNSVDIIKAYPHSLLESLAAGKPVLVSNGLPMADYVNKTDCGVTVDDLHLDNFLTCLNRLRQNYNHYQKNSLSLDLHRFSVENLLNSYGRIYRRVSE